MFLEGAKWDGEKEYIIEPEPMKVILNYNIFIF